MPDYKKLWDKLFDEVTYVDVAAIKWPDPHRCHSDCCQRLLTRLVARMRELVGEEDDHPNR